MSVDSLEGYKAAAQAIATAVLTDDHDTALQIANEVEDPRTLALVIASLTALVHVKWAATFDLDRETAMETWAEMMLGIEQDRTGTR